MRGLTPSAEGSEPLASGDPLLDFPSSVSQLVPTCLASDATLLWSPESHSSSSRLRALSSTFSTSCTSPCPSWSITGTGSRLASSAGTAVCARAWSSSRAPPTNPRQVLAPHQHLSG